MWEWWWRKWFVWLVVGGFVSEMLCLCGDGRREPYICVFVEFVVEPGMYLVECVGG